MNTQIAPAPADRVAGSRAAWRSLLEARWQQRLSTVTELSLAYHDAAGRSGGHGADAHGESRQVRRLLREATAARRALVDTEEALARLSGGSYGRCEQCSASIPADALLAEPESRYCAECCPGLRCSSARPQPQAPSGPARRAPAVPGLHIVTTTPSPDGHSRQVY